MYLNEPAISRELADRVRNAPKVPHPAYAGVLTPDFGALFPISEHAGAAAAPIEWLGAGYCDRFEENCANCCMPLPPRLAYLLHAGAEIATDMLALGLQCTSYADLHLELESTLPPTVLRHLTAIGEFEAGRWLGSFVATVRTIAARLAVGEVPYPRNTAEEMALHIAIERADDYLVDTIPELGEDDTRELFPATTEDRDEDLARVSDILFEDHDVLMLFDAALDGIEDPDSAIGAHLGVANLHARDWFKPFRDTDLVPAFAPPGLTTAMTLRLGANPDPDRVLDVAQRWLDEVAQAGAVESIEVANDDLFIIAVNDVPLNRPFAVCVNRTNTLDWDVRGLIEMGAGGMRSLYSRSDLDRFWVGAAA